ncbi:zinc finger domain-containing protein [Encephalitozoon intestinalis ATCC 50506]|uniref:Zinc finger domain-containing protein n=1 Tax=Encephalitozoon intestinalis (strain ATCC 50506) TaxID=876142 RepID=E0S6V1_ENCIT|nr:zinc finger domain-containing protein [Encephalitozoon intestinalis ATCC 50506]ADM11436.1 zinc finger domain-containing protein [Encephalitozoon intestinalis ATCC 50506]UTX45132.1 zinc finger domain-containing protein [Encephalitozoon intestinalis]
MEDKEGYERVVKDNTKETDMKCASCGWPGKMNIVDLDDTTENVICAFVCEKCGDRSVKFLEKTYDKRGSVRIECFFDRKEDLTREINLSQMASVEIISENLSFKISSTYPSIQNVESFLIQGKDQIKNLCGKGNITTGPGGEVLRNPDVSKETCEKKLEDFRDLMSNPKFKLIIEDDFGLSRVAPVGKNVLELRNADVSELNDDKVKHIFKKKSE